MHGQPTQRAEGGLRELNAMMTARILAMPTQPYQDGCYVLRVAEIRGRTSGRIINVPIGVIQVDGARYLISPDSNRPWARNLRTAGECTLTARDSRERYRATPAPDDEAIAALRAYLPHIRFAADDFPFTATTPDAQMRAELGRVAVFRLTPDP